MWHILSGLMSTREMREMPQWFPFAHWLWTQTTDGSHLTEFSAWKIWIYMSQIKKKYYL